MFSFIQANCGRGRAACIDIGVRMRDHGHSFALLQEPYADVVGRITGFPAGMRVFGSHAVEGRKRSAAVIIDDPDAICLPVESLTTEAGVCVRVTGKHGTVYLTSIYCHAQADLTRILSYMDTILLLASSTPVILSLDANAVSPLWFSKRHEFFRGQLNYRRGEQLDEWILGSRANVLNQVSEVYTFDNGRGQSDIDVTIVNEAASTWAAYDWSVDEWDLSDHNMITVVTSPSPANAVESYAPVPSWKLANANWRLFDSELVEEIEEHLSQEDIRMLPLDTAVSALRLAVQSVCDRVLGRRPSRAQGKVKWWTAELSTKRREVRRLRRRLQDARRRGHESAPYLAAHLRTAVREFKTLILKTKEENWRRFVGDHRDDPWGHVYRICRGRKRTTDLRCLRSDDGLVVTWHDCASLLLHSFFPVAESSEDIVIPDEAAPALEAFEVGVCVARLKSRRSPGLDGITGGICKAVWRAIPEHLTALYSRCLTEGYFPLEWKCPRVVALLKGPDKDRSDPASYRGICLLPVFGKVLEGIMVDRMKEVLPDGNRWQFGFRPGRCVEDAWKHVMTSVAASQAVYVLGLFVDFKGAFDNIEWSAAMRRLIDAGCKEASLWRSFFCGRKARMTSRYGEVEVEVTRGCPQGSISGPFIWNTMMDVLLQRLEPLCTFSAYADDLLVLVEGRSRAELERRAAELMSVVGTWGAEVGVSISTSKTAMMMLKGRFAVSRPPVVRFAGASLPYVDKYRYLGITVGERLNFQPHIAGLRDKLTGVVGALGRVLRVDWGLSPRARRTVYAGLMVPCALFGASVWYSAVRGESGARRRLISCQRVMLLGCLPVCRTVSTVALQVLAGAPPLDLVAKQLAIRFKVKRAHPLEDSDWLFGLDVANLDQRQMKALLEEGMCSEWQRRWDSDEHGRPTHQFIPDACFVYSRRDFGFGLHAGFLLTGHGSLNAFLHQRSLSATPACQCGAEYEDWQHVLVACPLYADLRDLDGLGARREGTRWDFSRVLETPERLLLLEMFARAVFTRRRRGME